MAMSSYLRTLRAQVGHARLLMPSVSGIVRDESGSVLLVQQRDDGSWTTPGGAMEMDETPADAVAREVWEETGLVVTPVRIIAVYGGPAFLVRYPNGDETQYVSTVFECRVRSGELLAKGDDGDEVQAARFWSLDAALKLPLAPWLVDVLPRLYDTSDATWFEPASWTKS